MLGVFIAFAVSAGLALPEETFFGPFVSLFAFLAVAGILLSAVSRQKGTAK
ncbi:hypothetical protein BSNK01_25020 [Bacillaceae bacterium]